MIPFLEAWLLSMICTLVFSQEYQEEIFESYLPKQQTDFPKYDSNILYEGDLKFGKGFQYGISKNPQHLHAQHILAQGISGLSASSAKNIGDATDRHKLMEINHILGEEDIKLEHEKEIYGNYGAANVQASEQNAAGKAKATAVMGSHGADANQLFNNYGFEISKEKEGYITDIYASGEKFNAQPHKVQNLHVLKASTISSPRFGVAAASDVLIPVGFAKPVTSFSNAEITGGISGHQIISEEFMKAGATYETHIPSLYEAKKSMYGKEQEVSKGEKMSVAIALKKPHFQTYEKKINIPISYTKPVIVPVPKKVPYPVEYEQPTIVPVKKAVKYMIPKYKPIPIPVEKYFPVPVVVKKPFRIPVAKPVPVPHVVEKPYPVAVSKHVPFHVPDYKAVVIPVNKYVKIPVPKYKPLPVIVNKYIPVKIPKYKRIPIYITKNIPMPVTKYKSVPYIVNKYVPTPYQVLKKIPIPVVKEVPMPYPVYRSYPVPVKRYVPVAHTVVRHVPIPVVKNVPYYKVFQRPVTIPIHKKIPVPVPVYTHQYIPVVKVVKSFVPVNKYVQIPIERTIHVPVNIHKIIKYPVERRIHMPVQYNRFIPIPTPRIIGIPYHYPKPVPIPVLKHVGFPYTIMKGISSVLASHDTSVLQSETGLSSLSQRSNILSAAGGLGASAKVHIPSLPIPPVPFSYSTVINPKYNTVGVEEKSVRIAQAGLLSPSLSSYGVGLKAVTLPKRKTILGSSYGTVSYDLSQTALSTNAIKSGGASIESNLNAYGIVDPIASSQMSSGILSSQNIFSPTRYSHGLSNSLGSYESEGSATIIDHMPLSSGRMMFKRSVPSSSEKNFTSALP